MIVEDRPRTESVEPLTGHERHDSFIGADVHRDDVVGGGQVKARIVADVRDVAQRLERAGMAGPHLQGVARFGDGGRPSR